MRLMVACQKGEEPRLGGTFAGQMFGYTKRAQLSLRPLVMSKLHALQGADFVACWVAQIYKIH